MDLRRRSIIAVKILMAVSITILSFYLVSLFNELPICCLLLRGLSGADYVGLLMLLTNRVRRWPLWRLSTTSDSTDTWLATGRTGAQNLLGNVDSVLLAPSLKRVSHF